MIEMIEFILSVVICSLWCFGIWIASDEGMILYKPKELAEKYLPYLIYKPLFGCVICYSSIHGGSLFMLINGDLKMLLPAIVCTAGLNYMIVQKYA